MYPQIVFTRKDGLSRYFYTIAFFVYEKNGLCFEGWVHFFRLNKSSNNKANRNYVSDIFVYR